MFQSVEDPPSTTHETQLGPDSPPSSTLTSSASSVVDEDIAYWGLSSPPPLAVDESSSLDDGPDTSSRSVFCYPSVPGVVSADSAQAAPLLDHESGTSLDTLDLCRLFLSIDDRMQRRELELIRVIVTLMESPSPFLDTSLRQSISEFARWMTWIR